MTYDEMYTKLTSGTVNTVSDLSNLLSSANTYKATTPTTFTTPTATTAATTPTTTQPQSSYKFEDWAKSKGYTYSFDPVANTYKLNNVNIPSNLFTNFNQGYGTEQQYQNILDTYANTQGQLDQYQSQYEQQLQDLYAQLEAYQAYQTPEELQQYLMELIQGINQPFTYDPNQDTGLKTAQEAAGKAVRETAGTKGTLYSSGTLANVATQQGALIPQFEEKAYSRYADAQNRKVQLASTLMQWDQMQADRSKDQLDIIKTKYEYIMALDAQDFEEFKIALEQQNWEKQNQLAQEQLNLEKKAQEIENAYRRVDALGYVDNTTSVILGLPVGTKAQWAKELEIQQKQELDKMKKEYDNQVKLQKEQAKIDKQLLDYKQKIQDKSDAAKMKKQYEYDKSLAKYKYELETGKTTGSSNIIANAKSYLGSKYVYGGNSKTKGLDCSALTQQVMAQAGITLPRTAYEQSKVGQKVGWNDLQPGDLVFFDTLAKTSKNVDHVGIYIGNGQMIHASSSNGKVVQVNMKTSYWQSKFTVARRNSSSGSYPTSKGYDSSSGSVGVGKNSSSASTKSVQTLLNKLGYGLTADGSYGMKTTEAVRAFQSANKLTVDGIVGPKTLAKLKSVAASKSSSKKTTTATKKSSPSYWEEYASKLGK